MSAAIAIALPPPSSTARPRAGDDAERQILTAMASRPLEEQRLMAPFLDTLLPARARYPYPQVREACAEAIVLAWSIHQQRPDLFAEALTRLIARHGAILQEALMAIPPSRREEVVRHGLRGLSISQDHINPGVIQALAHASPRALDRFALTTVFERVADSRVSDLDLAATYGAVFFKRPDLFRGASYPRWKTIIGPAALATAWSESAACRAVVESEFGIASLVHMIRAPYEAPPLDVYIELLAAVPASDTAALEDVAGSTLPPAYREAAERALARKLVHTSVAPTPSLLYSP